MKEPLVHLVKLMADKMNVLEISQLLPKSIC